MGVRRALETALRVANDHNGPVATHGPLIHNPQVLELLETKGVRSFDECDDFESGCVIIRAHGVAMKTKQELAEAGHKVVDATCPHVIRVQVILDKFTRKGYRGIIAGDANHPEVMGLLGHCYQGAGIVINSPDDLLKLDPEEPAVLVAQTTHHEGAFEEIAQKAREVLKKVEVFRTICGATHLRQTEVQQLAQQVDCMVVVGGKNSGNTKRLAQIAADAGVPALHVESAEELDLDLLSNMTTVGVTAGASTPNWLIKQVVQRLDRIKGQGESGFKAHASSMIRFLLYSNLYVAMGAAGICYASVTLQGFQHNRHFPFFLAISSLYLYCIHLANHFLDKESDEYNDPDRGRFFLKNKNFLAVTMFGAGFSALALSWLTGPAPFLLLAFITLMGIIYSMPILPACWTKRGRIRRIKDIPCSKTLSVTGGWVAVTTVLPALDLGTPWTFRTIFAMVFVALLIFIRSAVIEVMDVQGDLIVGAETTPIVIGEKRTVRLLEQLSLFLLLFMPAVYLFGFGSGLFLWLALCCVYAAGIVIVYKRQMIAAREWFEFIIESNFILAGIIAYLWHSLIAPV